MGLFDSAFGSTGGLLGNLSDPQQAAQLNMALGLLAAGGPSRTPIGLGQALAHGVGAGMQGYQQAVRSQNDEEERKAMAGYRNAQMEQFQQKTKAAQAQQAAIAGLKAKIAGDPTYRPSAADLLDIDPESALKGMIPGAVDFGLEPKIGLNPSTNKPAYFIQDKRGGTKWLDAGVPPNLQLIPGNDYNPPQLFNKQDGTLGPVSGQRAPMQSPQSSATGMMPTFASAGGAPVSATQPQEVDTLAPWNRITSPKEQDEFKKRVYETDAKRLDALREQVASGDRIMRDLERFGELNRKQETGGILDRQGWLPTTDPEKREMESIQARLAPNMRPAGSGTTSDRDLALYLQGLPGIDKEGPVNKNIRDQFAKDLDEARRQLAFREQYLTEKGHLTGVSEAYQQAVENGKSGGLDISQLSPEVAEFLRQQNPEAFERGVARLGKNSTPAEAAPAPKAAIPQAAVNMLRMNPKLRDQFDAKYGAGSAAQYLGK